MSNLSFTTSGALPTSSVANASKLGINGSTVFSDPNEAARKSLGLSPAANALSAAQRPTYTPPPPAQAPTTPVKSVTVNNPDGSSHVVAYHAPETGTTDPKPTQPEIPTSQGSTDPRFVGTSAAGQTYTGANGRTYSEGGGLAPVPTGDTTFPGTVNALSDASMNGSPTAKGYIASTSNYGAGNIPIGQNGNAITGRYSGLIDSLLKGATGQEIGHQTTGTTPVGEGNALAIASGVGNLITGLTNQENQELTGNAQGLTAQSQAANAENAAAGQAVAGQGQTILGLSNAGTLAKGEPTAQGQTTYNPLTNSFSGGSYKDNLKTIVDSIKNGSIGFTDGVNSISSLSPTAKADVLSALGPGFDTVASDANAATKSSNIQKTGTAQTEAYNSVYSKATADAAAYSQQRSAINAVGNQAISLMQDDPAINKFALQFGNQKINQLQTQLSSPQYAAFSTAIQSLQARIGQALQAGEIPTAATGNAQSIANGNITLDALSSTLQQVDREMGSFVDTQNSLANYAKSQMQGGSGGGSNDPLGIR